VFEHATFAGYEDAAKYAANLKAAGYDYDSAKNMLAEWLYGDDYWPDYGDETAA
jgi:hypothetical protein